MNDHQFLNFSELYRSLTSASTTSPTAAAELIASVVALVNSAYRGDSSKAGWTTEADLLDGQRTDAIEIQRLLEEPNEVLLGAVDAATGTPLACVRLRRCLEPVESREKAPTTTAYLGMLTVSPTLQSKGFGRSLLEHAERFCRLEWQATEMHMTVISVRKSLIDWYVRRGYTLTQEFQSFPYGDARFGIPLRDDLRFQILRKRLS